MICCKHPIELLCVVHTAHRARMQVNNIQAENIEIFCFMFCECFAVSFGRIDGPILTNSWLNMVSIEHTLMRTHEICNSIYIAANSTQFYHWNKRRTFLILQPQQKTQYFQ